MHYTPNGKETTDRSQVGVWFYPLDNEPQFNMTSNCACVFPDTWSTIPPHDPSRAVDWGNESWDEMFFGRVVWKYDTP